MRCDMQCGGSTQAGAKHNYRATRALPVRRHRTRRGPRGPTGRVAQARCCRRSPGNSFPRLRPAGCPTFPFPLHPAIGPIGIAIESQQVDRVVPALLGQSRSSPPNFQFAAFEWNWLSNGRAGINPVRSREQHQHVRKWGQGNHGKIQIRPGQVLDAPSVR